MTEQEIEGLASLASGLPSERVAEVEARLPRWGDLQHLHGVVEGLAAARCLLQMGGFAPLPLNETAAVAGALLVKGRREVAKARATPLPPDVAEVVELDRTITAGLREGKPINAIIQEVDERQRETGANTPPTGERV